MSFSPRSHRLGELRIAPHGKHELSKYCTSTCIRSFRGERTTAMYDEYQTLASDQACFYPHHVEPSMASRLLHVLVVA